jgi:hypothetical protein
MSQDQNGQSQHQFGTIEAKPAVAGQASGGAHHDGAKTFDPRTRAELEAAGAANRQAQAAHALPKIEPCKTVDGQASPNASVNRG